MKKVLGTLIIICVTCLMCSAQTYTLEDKWVDCGNNAQLMDPYYSQGVTYTWDGPVKSGKANGQGIATKYVNGKFDSKYEGTYRNGIREGNGTLTNKDGSVTTGNFVNGQLTGRGTWHDEDGDSYEGEFINYVMHGKGKLKFGDGTTFEGSLIDNHPYTGKLTLYTGEVIYMQKEKEVDKIVESKTGYSPKKMNTQLTEYFDEDWNRCDPKQAAYYRIITYEAPNKPKGVVKDYYITGEIQGKQYPVYIDYDDEGKTFLEGEQIFYHKNGKVSMQLYNLNNKPNGPITSYYQNGKIESITMYNHGILSGDCIGYYEDGNIKSVRKYQNGDLLNNKYLQISDQAVFLIYDEDFERNREQWEFNGQSGRVDVFTSNSILMQASPDRTVSGGFYTGFSPRSVNIISVSTCQLTPGKGVVSLLFGWKDWDNYCEFSIVENKHKFIYKKNGVLVQNDKWEVSSAIQPDENTLTVINDEDDIVFSVNGEIVKRINRIYFDGSFCGLSYYNPSEETLKLAAGAFSVAEKVESRDAIAEYLPTESNDNEWNGNGSGFFVSQKGYIATNYHVVKGTKALQANFTRNGQTESYPASVVVTDPDNDLAIIKIDDSSYKDVDQLPYGLLTRTKDTGSEVFAMGYPIAWAMGTEVKFTDGKISSKSGIGGDVRVYQISVPIQPGNSGGPLFDTKGNVVGITSSGLNKDYFQSENVNYAIKASYLKNLIEACPEPIVMEEKVETPASSLSLTDKIKQYEGYVVLILTK